MSEDKISLATIYTECNNHLRETDKSRDQIISFYLIVVGAFLAVANTSAFENFVIPSSLLLIFFGVFVSQAIIGYRIWHTRYSYTAQLLVALSRGNQKDFKKIERDNRERSHHELRVNTDGKSHRMTFDWIKNKYIYGTVFFTFTASLIVSFIPLYLFFYYFFRIDALVLYGLIVLYFIAFQIYSAQKTYSESAKCPWAKWMLQGISQDVDLTYDTLP